jgi:hypothetical protein
MNGFGGTTYGGGAATGGAPLETPLRWLPENMQDDGSWMHMMECDPNSIFTTTIIRGVSGMLAATSSESDTRLSALWPLLLSFLDGSQERSLA